MREQLVQESMFWKYNSSSEVLVPNYTPRGWWENDLFRVTKAGFWHEYEIKTSVADFTKDFKKYANHQITEVGESHMIQTCDDKHLLLNRHLTGEYVPPTEELKLPPNHYRGKYKVSKKAVLPYGPNHFWFVIPESLLPNLQARIPAYAGLATMRILHEDTPQERVYGLKIVKKAPKLHKEKQFEDKVELWRNLGQTFYWRYWKQAEKL